MRGLANQLQLVLFGIEKFKSVLKTFAIPYFSLQLQRLCAFRHLKFQFNYVAQPDIACDGGSQASLRDILGAAMITLFCTRDDAYIQQKSSVGSRCGPCWFVLNGHGLPKLS